MEYFFGIDFGTTNSAAVSWSSTGNFERYGVLEGLPYPSFVAIDKTTGKVYKGREAWNRRYELEEYCEIIRSVKTFLWNSSVSWNIGGSTWTPEDVAVEIFKGLRDKVTSHGLNMENAVLAVPVGFDAQSRKVLRQAAQRAGISVLSFISEPTSAFLSYYNALKYYKKVAIFDWGGGTLDISLLLIEGDVVSEAVTSGDPFAGDKIDKKLAEYVHKEIARKENTEDSLFEQMPPSARGSLTMRCEKAKIELSNKKESTLLFNYHFFGPIIYTLTREKSNELIRPELERLVKKLMNTLKRARWSKEEVDKIVLVGGSCKIPLLREMLDELFGEKCFYPDDPDWGIAKGAAKLAKEPGSYVAAHDFGVVLSDDSFVALIKKEDRINDFEKSFTFGLVEDSEDANLIFAERYDSKIEFERIGKYMPIQCFGFSFEPIEVKVFGSDDLVIKIVAKSKNRSEEHKEENIFEDVIKFRYRLPKNIL